MNSAYIDFNKVINTLGRIKGVVGHFCGISIPHHFVGAQREVLEKSNQHAREKFLANYIGPLHQVRVVPADGIHYDQDTVDKVFDKINNHFLDKIKKRNFLSQ
jgi:hypothetical protein